MAFSPNSVAILILLFAALALLPRNASVVVGFARALALMSVGFAVWSLVVLPGQFFAVRDNIHFRHPFYEHLALVPTLAFFGVLALLTIHKTLIVGARPHSWREWMAARAQCVVAVSVLFTQIRLVNEAACATCLPFPAHLWSASMTALVTAQAAVRQLRAFRAGAISTGSPAE